MTGKTKICPFCQNEFVAENASVYCSARCRKGMAKKRREEEKLNRRYTCAYCGVIFNADKKRKFCCDEHRLMSNGRLRATPSPRKKPNLNLAKINELARAEGMNYGQYVAKYGL